MAWTKESREKAILAKRLSGYSNQFSKAKALNLDIPTAYNKNKPGTFKGKKHSQESKDKIREKALLSDHRRLKKKMIEYNGILLDSTWELILAKRLDSLNVKWIRPKPIKWKDSDGVFHNYFPDFYLEKYDLYIDTKNPYACIVQADKIVILKNLLTNLLILDNIRDIETYNPDVTEVDF